MTDGLFTALSGALILLWVRLLLRRAAAGDADAQALKKRWSKIFVAGGVALLVVGGYFATLGPRGLLTLIRGDALQWRFEGEPTSEVAPPWKAILGEHITLNLEGAWRRSSEPSSKQADLVLRHPSGAVLTANLETCASTFALADLASGQLSAQRAALDPATGSELTLMVRVSPMLGPYATELSELRLTRPGRPSTSVFHDLIRIEGRCVELVCASSASPTTCYDALAAMTARP